MPGHTDTLSDDCTFDDNYGASQDQSDTSAVGPNSKIQRAADARRRLEAYWEQKALNKDLRELNDDWD